MLKPRVNFAESVFEHVDSVGRGFISIFTYTAQVLVMVYLSVRAAVYDQAQGMRTIFSVISAQVYFTGFQALPLISVLALATGAVCVLESFAQLQLLGQSSMVGSLLITIIVREVGPLLTALIVVARSGTAVATEIGNMRANREIEALETMGINPLSYIVFPRLVGGTVSVICLAFYFNIIALFGGFLVASLIKDMPFSFYSDLLANSLTMDDIGMFLLKNTFSGLIIFVVCCYQGLAVQQSAHEVPAMTTKAVVNAIIYVVIFNLGVSMIFYIRQLQGWGLI
jgi:phospholipid/cholesterol/gamma-HCH transport system permease protein